MSLPLSSQSSTLTILHRCSVASLQSCPTLAFGWSCALRPQPSWCHSTGANPIKRWDTHNHQKRRFRSDQPNRFFKQLWSRRAPNELQQKGQRNCAVVSQWTYFYVQILCRISVKILEGNRKDDPHHFIKIWKALVEESPERIMVSCSRNQLKRASSLSHAKVAVWKIVVQRVGKHWLRRLKNN